MKVTRERVADGVVEHMFELIVAEEKVPGVIWFPEGAKGSRPLVLMGHGGSQHKKVIGIRTRARTYVAELGYAVAAIDAPGHGDRITREEAATLSERTGSNIREGRQMDPERLKMMAGRTASAAPEWKAALDAVQQLDYVGAEGPVGYWGVSMGTAIGVPFVASEPRIKCAIFGLAGLRPGATEFEAAARSISIPVQFSFQWEDTVASHDNGIALFEAFGSEEKSMHINPGGHVEIPPRERESWQAFYVRHLGSAQ